MKVVVRLPGWPVIKFVDWPVARNKETVRTLWAVTGKSIGSERTRAPLGTTKAASPENVTLFTVSGLTALVPAEPLAGSATVTAVIEQVCHSERIAELQSDRRGGLGNEDCLSKRGVLKHDAGSVLAVGDQKGPRVSNYGMRVAAACLHLLRGSTGTKLERFHLQRVDSAKFAGSTSWGILPQILTQCWLHVVAIDVQANSRITSACLSHEVGNVDDVGG